MRQGQDTLGKGRPQVLNHFDSNGVVTVQEAVGEGGRNPAKKLFLNASGEVTAQCLLDAEGKKLNTCARSSSGERGRRGVDRYNG